MHMNLIEFFESKDFKKLRQLKNTIYISRHIENKIYVNIYSNNLWWAGGLH